MQSRRRMTMVEWLIVMAILGILASIALPQLQRASRQAARSTAGETRGQPSQPDGQLNVIEPPETSEGGGRAEPDRGGGGGGRAFPIGVAIVIAIMVLRRLQRRGLRRDHHGSGGTS